MNWFEWIRDMGSDNRFALMVWLVAVVVGLGVLIAAWVIWTTLEIIGAI